MTRAWIVIFSLLAAACGANPGPAQIQRPRLDSAAPWVDPHPAYGTISGDCGILDLATPGAAVLTSTIDFADVAFDVSLLSAGGQEVVSDGNLNDGSLLSEALSYEVMFRCEAAALLATETEIVYDDPNGKKTDLLLEIDSENVGVSVTRAFTFPLETPYTEVQALELLNKKLGDIPLSAANASTENAWSRSVLHVIAYDAQATQSLTSAYAQLDSSVTLDTILVITATDGDDAYLY